MSAIRELDLCDHVMYVEPYLPDDMKAALITGARALVLVSYDEGFGIPAAEAMAGGVPLVVSNRGALPEIVRAAGVQVDPFDPDAIAAALSEVLMWSEAQYRDQATRGKDRAAAFSSIAAADRLALCLLHIVDDIKRLERL